jgi:uncharacterized protein DUF4124
MGDSMIRRGAIAAIGTWVFLGVLPFGSATAAPVYKWVDERGTIHFSDTRPKRSTRLSDVQVIPDKASVPMVRNGPPADFDSELDLYDQEEGYEPYWLEEDDLDAESSSLIVVEGARDPAVRFRAFSPLNRPGKPVRVFGGRPSHHRHSSGRTVRGMQRR